MPRDSTRKLASTGGVSRLSHQILIQLRMSGMNSKDHLRGVVKPRSKQELIDEILAFWETVDEHKCHKYIGHLKKVIPKVIEYNGNATGY